MKAKTVRNIPDDLAAALHAEKLRRGLSLNRTAVTLMREALGLPCDRQDNGLARFAGTWSEDQFREFEDAQAPFNVIDEGLWK